ncbi:MAG: thiamine pyrophosphate-binding protein, partial [Gemmatimonadetes bacterium]|nr:thiamine pyrophosphate-binding protein [Gemmatimonadota bacterium]NIQ59073.1 thiamine pyrophosphate-binding protein [Gemmatimonadota bacterium]NIU79274.1 thiamine pyrophosphate-binding protein [Gammaproteobacteria bacterium]NIX47966.1 thiamine pyrophosphate-binding protein [Gemmatimonadota bacterium]NIY12326.1 thiamine pyrophosphate-binding protein [Gemmatimonadota bacterium]
PFTFGIPGTHNIELYDALATSDVRPILVTDEQGASFMADGVWRASGKLGCANVVPGAG